MFGVFTRGRAFRKKASPKTTYLLREVNAFLAGADTKERFLFGKVTKHLLSHPTIRKGVHEAFIGADDDIVPELLKFREHMAVTKIWQLDALLSTILKIRILDHQLAMKTIAPTNLTDSLSDYLISKERVHSVNGKDELLKRLTGNRLCFGLFHPLIPELPLVTLYVALAGNFPKTIQEILSEANPFKPSDPSLAIFYSISVMKSLKSLGLGKKLIYSALPHLQHEYPTIKTFRTLSPIVNFYRWLNAQKIDSNGGNLKEHCQRYLERLKQPMIQPRDPVGCFHYGNGAILSNIIEGAWPENAESFGMMASYLYEPDQLTFRSEEFWRSLRKGY